MNIVSNHNRLLRGAAIPTAGGDMWTSGLEYTQNGEISGYSGSAFYQQECPCDSAAIVDSAFNKSTAWVDEQNYLTEHQDVSNLPYVQNSVLGYNGNLISSISGDGFFAESANNSYHADDADHATYADSATHADSADFVATANFANSASSALNAEIANVAYTALTANFLDGGWELDVDGFITAYNNSAFAGGGGGGMEYTGIAPIVVNNELHLISAESARLGVESPLYFVEDTSSSTVIGIYESALSGRDWTDDITAASANAYNEAVNNITAVKSADSATYDNLGREITATYLTAVTGDNTPYSAGANIDISNHVVSGKDWTSEIQDASANAVNEAINTITAVEFANSASALTTSAGWDVTEYSAGANIDISNHIVSGKDWTNDIQNASANAVAQIPDVTGLPYVENSALDYTPGGHLVSSISGDALYAVSAEGAFNAETANYSYVAETANYVEGGWEYDASSNITGYSGSAFAATGAGKVYDGVAPIVVNNEEDKISANTIELSAGNGIDITETANKIVISCTGGSEGKVYTGVAPIVVDNSQTTGVISAQTARLGVQSPLYFVEDTSASTVIGISGDLVGQYIPYTATAANEYFTDSAITVSSESGYVQITPKHTYYQDEAHVRVVTNYDNGTNWLAEIDGADSGHIHQIWQSGENTCPGYMMDWTKNGLYYDYFTANDNFEVLASWTTGDWNNAKALYNHVNTASASWGGGQCIPYTATATKTFVTNSAIKASSYSVGPGAFYTYYSTAELSPSGIYVNETIAQTNYSSYHSANIVQSNVYLNKTDSNNNTYSRLISTTADKIYSGSTLIVDVVDAAKTVKDNSANWANVQIVASTADATGANIIYFVTGA